MNTLSHSPVMRTALPAPAQAMAASVVLLAAGISLWLCLPDTRGFHAQLGWLPLWTLVSPALCVLVQGLRLRARRQRCG